MAVHYNVPLEKQRINCFFFQTDQNIFFTKKQTSGRSTQSKKAILGKFTPMTEAAILVEVFYHVLPKLNKGTTSSGLFKSSFSLY